MENLSHNALRCDGDNSTPSQSGTKQLDIATVQASIARGQENKKLLNKTYFAVGGSEKDWLGNLNNRMAGADQVIWDCVKKFKPWEEDGNALLYTLTKIAAKDKHVDLIPASAHQGVFYAPNINLSHPSRDQVFVSYTAYVSAKPEKQVIFSVRSPGKIEITGPVTINAVFGFGKVYGLQNKPAIQMLNKMSVMCQEIVQALELAAKS